MKLFTLWERAHPFWTHGVAATNGLVLQLDSCVKQYNVMFYVIDIWKGHHLQNSKDIVRGRGISDFMQNLRVWPFLRTPNATPEDASAIWSSEHMPLLGPRCSEMSCGMWYCPVLALGPQSMTIMPSCHHVCHDVMPFPSILFSEHLTSAHTESHRCISCYIYITKQAKHAYLCLSYVAPFSDMFSSAKVVMKDLRRSAFVLPHRIGRGLGRWNQCG